MRLFIAIAMLSFWIIFFISEAINNHRLFFQRLCDNVTEDAVLFNHSYSKQLKIFMKSDWHRYHTVPIAALVACLLALIHIVFMIYRAFILSVFLVTITTFSTVSLSCSYLANDWDCFEFRILGFLIGVCIANMLIIADLFYQKYIKVVFPRIDGAVRAFISTTVNYILGI